MIFKLFLNYVFKANSEEEKLQASLIYGWSLAIIGIICAIIGYSVSKISPDTTSYCFLVSLITLVLFIFRYTSVKPLLGAAAAGITVIAIGSILDSLSNRRDSSFSIGALIGVIFFLFLMITKNLFISWYYLIRETVRYLRYKKTQVELDETVLYKN